MVIENPSTVSCSKDSRIELQIQESDISEMDYRLNGPMSSCPHDNAVTLALRRFINPELKLSVSVSDGVAFATIAGKRYPLGERLGKWLSRAYTGVRMFPIRESIFLPVSILKDIGSFSPHSDKAGTQTRSNSLKPDTSSLFFSS